MKFVAVGCLCVLALVAIGCADGLGGPTSPSASAAASGLALFLAPIGYLNAPRSIAKSLVHDPQRGPLVRRAFEEYATG